MRAHTSPAWTAIPRTARSGAHPVRLPPTPRASAAPTQASRRERSKVRRRRLSSSHSPGGGRSASSLPVPLADSEREGCHSWTVRRRRPPPEHAGLPSMAATRPAAWRSACRLAGRAFRAQPESTAAPRLCTGGHGTGTACPLKGWGGEGEGFWVKATKTAGAKAAGRRTHARTLTHKHTHTRVRTHRPRQTPPKPPGDRLSASGKSSHGTAACPFARRKAASDPRVHPGGASPPTGARCARAISASRSDAAGAYSRAITAAGACPRAPTSPVRFRLAAAVPGPDRVQEPPVRARTERVPW